MRNKVLLCGFVIVIMAFFTAFGYTNARYYSTASMTGETDVIKAIGGISIYHPEWVGGYSGADDGSGVFDVSQIPIEYANIHYRVTNKINDEINNENITYYIRIVAEDGSHNIPIEYNVHEYNNPGHVFSVETGTGYGPFTLGVDSEAEVYYSIRANWVSTDMNHLAYAQHLKVQMVTKRLDGTLKVMDEAPLNMQYSGDKKVKVTFDYYIYGTDPAEPAGDSQTIMIGDNFTIDFKNNEQLTGLGITLPGGYAFHDVRHNINGAGENSGTATSVNIPAGDCLEGYHVNVYLLPRQVSVQLTYYDYTAYTEDAEGNKTYTEISDSRQSLKITRGTTIDFADVAQRNSLGIILPVGYALQGLGGNLVVNPYTDTSVAIPDGTADLSYGIDVYMMPNGSATVNVSFYNSAVGQNNLVGGPIPLQVNVGTVIDFRDAASLSVVGISLPDGYDFHTAYCAELENAGTGCDAFTIPYSGANQTYNIDVVLDKIVTIITVPVKFYDSSGSEVSSTTVDMREDGTYEFTTDICRTLCPALNTMTSFTIYIANQWASTYEVGNTNTSENAVISVDYNKTYTSWTDFKLSDEGMYIYIKAWW